MKRQEQKGFTLIELLVVVTIIGILAAAAIPKLMKAMDKARLGRCNADIAAVKSASLMYNMDKGYYPGTVGGLTTEFLDNEPKGGANEAGATTYSQSGGNYTITCKVNKNGCFAYFQSSAGEVLTGGTNCP